MKESEFRENQDTLSLLRRLEGVVFAGQLALVAARSLIAECSCQNCGCDSRSGDQCNCYPRCHCQGVSDIGSDRLLFPYLGLVAALLIGDAITQLDIREKVVTSFAKYDRAG